MTSLPAGLPSTPIAAELQAHFEHGGSPADGIRLVEALERAAARALVPTVAKSKQARGSRLTPDWAPSRDDMAFAIAKGMPQSRVSAEAEKFRNYWTAKSGTGATKRDWAATWRNWIINTLERGYGRSSYQGHRPATYPAAGRAPTGSDAILAGMGRLARRIDERRTAAGGGGRQISDAADITCELDLEPR